MRHLVLLAAISFTVPAMAQDKVWTPAPVPSIGDGHIQPAARAGEPVADDATTPFSAAPLTSVQRNGATSADTYNGVQTPDLSGK